MKQEVFNPKGDFGSELESQDFSFLVWEPNKPKIQGFS